MVKRRTSSNGSLVTRSIGKGTPRRPKPTIEFTESQIPEIKNWEVGKTYTLELQVTLSRLEQGDPYGTGEVGNKERSARFSVEKVSTDTESKEKGDTDKD